MEGHGGDDDGCVMTKWSWQVVELWRSHLVLPREVRTANMFGWIGSR